MTTIHIATGVFLGDWCFLLALGAVWLYTQRRDK